MRRRKPRRVNALKKNRKKVYSFFMGHRKYLRDPSELLAFLWYMKKKGRGSLRNPCLSLCLAKLRFGLYLIKDVLSKQLDGV